jgi:hypothetical protein
MQLGPVDYCSQLRGKAGARGSRIGMSWRVALGAGWYAQRTHEERGDSPRLLPVMSSVEKSPHPRPPFSEG